MEIANRVACRVTVKAYPAPQHCYRYQNFARNFPHVPGFLLTVASGRAVLAKTRPGQLSEPLNDGDVNGYLGSFAPHADPPILKGGRTDEIARSRSG